jgi:type I restriction enzyme S subunit
MSEWREIALGEVIETNKSSINREYPNSEILYLDTGSITCNRINGLQQFELSNAPSRAKRLVKDLDIIYSSVRPNQLHYGIIRNPENNLVVSTGFVVITCNQDEIAPYFLYHYLSQNSTTEFLHSIAEGSTSAYPSLKPSDIEALEILLPPLDEQKTIAEVLSSLDDKIDLLHRQNQTLEQMAETLFRQWFVEEADERWEVRNLKELVDIGIGRTPPRKEFHWFSKSIADVKWVSIKDLGDSGVFVLDTSEYLTEEAVEKFNVPIIPPDTVLLSFKMTLGRVAITTEHMLSNEAIAHFKFNDETPFSKEFLYFYLKTYPYETLGSTSSIVTSINSGMIKDMEAIIPDDETLSKFENQVIDYFDKIKSNQKQIMNLSALRDTLLPKLMSGEIKVG